MSYTTHLVQDAVYWPPGTPDGYGGTSGKTPQAIKVRWEDHVVRMMNNAGEEFTSKARVFTSIQLDYGWLFLGTIAATGGSEPEDLDDAHRIQVLNRTQNTSGTIVVREAIL